MENNELYHWGVKGMKWGVRRSRKPSSSGSRRRDRQNDWSDDAREASRLRKKKASQMSNAELRRLNERTQLEQQYSRLHPNAFRRGMKIAAATATGLGTVMNLYNNSDKLVKLGSKVGNKIFDSVGNMVLKDIAKNMNK